MVRRKGELTRKAIDRDWPHQVAQLAFATGHVLLVATC